jgi:hypothetical protein
VCSGSPLENQAHTHPPPLAKLFRFWQTEIITSVEPSPSDPPSELLVSSLVISLLTPLVNSLVIPLVNSLVIPLVNSLVNSL